MILVIDFLGLSHLSALFFIISDEKSHYNAKQITLIKEILNLLRFENEVRTRRQIHSVS